FDRLTTGTVISIKVVGKTPFESSSKADVQITSPSVGYDGTRLKLTFAQEGTTLYYHWGTTGLRPSSDYRATVSITDSSGFWSASLAFTLSPRIPEPQVLSTSTDVFLPFHDLGLHFTRTYNYSSTFRQSAGPLGTGWT